MRPEDLIPPYTKDECKVAIHDRVWYVPPRFFSKEDFAFPGWSHESFFGNEQPVNIEYCSGNGTWIANQALKNPHINYVAIEKKFMRVRKIWSKIKNLNLQNLIVVCGEAFFATKSFFPADSINDVFVNFPDPWPKKRHAKNRLFQPAFIKEMSRIMQKGRTLTFVTDDHLFSDEVISFFNDSSDFKSYYPKPFYITDEASYGTSYFDELWRSKGKVIRYHKFVRISNG
jgi:tRNA (guanine-N7-)-methyltransferase